MFDIYTCNESDTARFTLGNRGSKTILVVGLNPSTANKEHSDPTVTRVRKVSENNGYDGFVMFNLYPLRATDPKKLPIQADKELIKTNINKIVSIAGDAPTPIFWAAWGSDISSRDYLKVALFQLNESIAKLGGQWVKFGPLNAKKHPRHPSRLSYAWTFSKFDMEKYSEIIT